VCVGVVAVTGRSCSLASKETPRTTPLSAIQPSMLLPGGSAPSNNEPSRQTAEGGCGDTAGRGSTNGQTVSDHKQTPCLLPADNFGLLFYKNSVFICVGAHVYVGVCGIHIAVW